MSVKFNETEDLGSTLMRVIRTLSESDSGEQREEEKTKLKQQFDQSDKYLNSLVLKNQKDLVQVMQIYARVSNRLATSRSRIKEIKGSLKACKELLHYKRDELKKLWLDGVEQKHILHLLEKIEQLKECPEKINHLLSKNEYLEATQLLVQSLDFIHGDLKNVDGLVEVKDILDAKKEKLYETLLENLTKQIYVETTWHVLSSLKRHSSFNNDKSKNDDFKRIGSDRSSRGKGSGSGRKTFGNPKLIRKQFLEVRGQDDDQEDVQKVLNNPKLAEIGGGARHMIVIDVECLAMMNKLPDALEHLKSELKSELQTIVTRSTQSLVDVGPYPQGDTRLLSELFSVIVDQFTLVVDGYRLVGEALKRSVSRHHCEPVRFDLAEVWAQAQTSIETMLTDYLDFKTSKSAALQQQQNASSGSGSSGAPSSSFSDVSNASTADINSYFVRRKTQRHKREHLFRFDYSLTALSMNDYAKEQNPEGSKEKLLVCQPNPHNITPIYPALMDFVKVVEAALKCEPGSHCTLYAFLIDYIKHVFLGQIHVDNGCALNSASNSMDAWKAITDPDALRELKVTRPLLQSTVGVKKSIDELSRYMRTLPLYCGDFLTMICNMVMQYKEICLAGYRGVVQPESEDKRIISAQWAKDEDISRHIKSFPNWQMVTSKEEISESPQEIEQRNSRETAMLKKNLGESNIPVHETLHDPNQLRSLGQLQESLDWFSKNILCLANDFQYSNLNTFGDLPKLQENSIQTLISLAKEFEDLSSTCLLVLHLEVRVHCFHYLHTIWRGPAGAQFFGGQDSTDPNSEVIKLTRNLSKIEEELTSSLQERKIRYIFEGVSHLISVIFIAAAGHIRKINSNGVKKMCRNIFAVQQTLTSTITGSRETSLDHAKQYYELFNQRPQEVLDGIVERGPIFTHEEYIVVMNLLHRSDPTSSESLRDSHIEKLGETMKQAGVRV